MKIHKTTIYTDGNTTVTHLFDVCDWFAEVAPDEEYPHAHADFLEITTDSTDEELRLLADEQLSVSSRQGFDLDLYEVMDYLTDIRDELEKNRNN